MLGTALGLPVFRQKYGHWVNEKSGYQLTAQWQTVLGMGGTFVSPLAQVQSADQQGNLMCVSVAFNPS